MEKVILREVSKPFKIVIPEEVKNKIDLTCFNVYNVEWSGTLFYTHEGSYNDNNLVLTVKDFYIQDVGTAGYTEYRQTPDVVTYALENDLLECNRGLIHSHNNMSTFFSGTDTSTLESEGKEHFHFLSLIVNNAGEYTAGLTTKIVSKQKVQKQVEEVISFRSFDGDHVLDSKGSEPVSEEINEVLIEWSRLEIDVKVPEVSAYIKERVEKVKSEKVSTPSYSTGGYTGRATIGYNAGSYQKKEKEREEKGSSLLFPWLKKKTISTEVDEWLNVNGDIDYEKAPYSPKSIEILVKKLVTGQVILTDPWRVGIASSINAMTKNFAEMTISEYESAIDNISDILLTQYKDEDAYPIEDNIDSPTIIAVTAYRALDLLKSYPVNPYLERLRKSLQTYIIEPEELDNTQTIINFQDYAN